MNSAFLEDLASRRRFGMKPGLDTMREVCRILGNPEERVRAIHVAGTNGKGAVCAMLDACLFAGGFRTGRYTSPHLVKLNERFFLDGAPVSDEKLEKYANKVSACLGDLEPTFFEALTAVAFLLYADESPDFSVLETGLGGRLDATNVCRPQLSVITRIGLDHCDWLGDTVEKIAFEKSGIIKPGVPVVLGRNAPEVVAVVKARAAELGAPFRYAPDMADESEIPSGFSLAGSFNRENAVTAIAALKVLSADPAAQGLLRGLSRVVWPGRFQRIGRFIIDGAHNPPAARALAAALESETDPSETLLIAGFCGDKDIDETLRILRPRVASAIAVRTNNPRSLAPEELVVRMRNVGMEAVCAESLKDALAMSQTTQGISRILICGSLFLAGEALAALGGYPWGSVRFDPAEKLRV
ncbi:MAG: bifunctional folylpolyglutamate synthase/dihydrofolate synthase [Kiritimatiellae bacterium]|nr:bifunctional folylpolyglutamate synthase/dihydrofolate synthase [Kiritimatiellia bacterium]